MASTQVARAAAQLHEAALDVARVAALRSTQPQEPTTGPQVPLQLGRTEDEDGGDGPMAAETVAGEMALVLAAKLAEHGYRVMFPPGRDAAAFKVTGLPSSPDVEVIAEYNGSAACHYTAAAQRRQPRSSPGSRSPATRRSRPPLLTRSSRRGTASKSNGTTSPLDGQLANPDPVTAALLGHLGILGAIPEARP